MIIKALHLKFYEESILVENIRVCYEWAASSDIEVHSIASESDHHIVFGGCSRGDVAKMDTLSCFPSVDFWGVFEAQVTKILNQRNVGFNVRGHCKHKHWNQFVVPFVKMLKQDDEWFVH